MLVITFTISLLAVIAGLVLSFLAVFRLAQADNTQMAQYSSWDRAMANWQHLYYCLRDHVAVEPARQRILSEGELRALLSTEDQEPRTQNPLLTHGDIHAMS